MNPRTAPDLALRGVCRRWPGGRGVGPVDLDVVGGTVVVVRGPNGSGKSTLLSAIAGVIPVAGEVRWSRRPAVGWVPAPARLSPARTPRTLLGLIGRPDGDPLGIDAFADVPMGRLSRGQRRRVVLAASLAATPDVLVWDEPLDALDEDGQERAIGALRAHRDRGGTAIVATHHPARWAPLADRVIHLHAGAIRP